MKTAYNFEGPKAVLKFPWALKFSMLEFSKFHCRTKTRFVDSTSGLGQQPHEPFTVLQQVCPVGHSCLESHSTVSLKLDTTLTGSSPPSPPAIRGFLTVMAVSFPDVWLIHLEWVRSHLVPEGQQWISSEQQVA